MGDQQHPEQEAAFSLDEAALDAADPLYRRVREVINAAITDATAGMTASLRRDAHRTLREHRKFRRQFEQRLAQRWGRAFNLYELFLIAAFDAGAMVNERSRERVVAENDLVSDTLVLLHARGCSVAAEMRALLMGGYGTGAQARWRTLHELAVVADVIAGHDFDLAERYRLHESVDALRNATVYQACSATLQEIGGSGYEPIPADEFQQLREAVEELVERYGPSYKRDWGWAARLFDGKAPRFDQLEELAGIGHLRPYYRLGMLGSHALAKSVADTVSERGPSRVLIAGATNYGLSDAGAGGVISLNHLTTLLLLDAQEKLDDPSLLAVAKALGELVHAAIETFGEIELRLEQDEALLWSATDDGQRGGWWAWAKQAWFSRIRR